MSSPGNEYPPRGPPRKFSTPTHSPRFSHGQYSPRFSPVNSPQGMYSPTNSSQHLYPHVNLSQTTYSPNHSSQHVYPHVNSSQIMCSPNHSSQHAFSPVNLSPRNQLNRGYSPRNSPQNSPLGYSSASPLHQQALRQSFNKSQDSFNHNSGSSLDSTDYNRRYTPYGQNKRNSQKRNSWNSNESYNIEDYILPSMLEDPWAGLKVGKNKNTNE